MEKVFEGIVDTEEKIYEDSLRPSYLSDFIGQEHIKKSLSLYIKAASLRGDIIDHVLFYGSPGLGKTTLATIIANESGKGVITTSGAIIQRPADIISTLLGLQEGDVLFIDEIHRLPKIVEEFLYPAMEDFAIDILCNDVDKGGERSATRMPLNKFTLVGATTRAGMISSPLRNRFGIDYHMEFYGVKDLSYIALRSAKILDVGINKPAADFIAKGSRGTPRIVNRIIKRCRDVAQIEGDGLITLNVVKDTFVMLRIDDNGLDAMDRKIMTAILEFHDGGPVGINTLAVTVGEDDETIEAMHEPFLIQQGFLERTPRGRKATKKAERYFSDSK